MSAREAYIAGSSGSSVNPGTTSRERDAFQRGRKSREVFNRRSKYKNWGDRKYQTGAGKRLDEKIGDFFRDKTSQGIGAFQAGMKAGKELFVDPIMKASENKRLMGELYKDEDSMDRIRWSLMTDKSKEFYEKYMRLADLTSDSDKAREYRETANTALRNAQINSRLNYGLGQLGYDTIGKEGFASYQPDFTGGEGTGFAEGSSPRFNFDNFLGGLRGTKAGKDFYNAALAAQANEPGDTMMSHAMKSFGSPRATFTSPAEMNREIQDYNNAVSVEDIMPIESVSNQPNIDDYNEMMTTPFNAASMYPNLNMAGIRNKYFPEMALEDITEDDINNAIAMGNYGFMSSPQLNQLYQ